MSFKDGKFGLLTIRYAVNPDEFYCDCKCGNEVVVWRSLLANRVQLDCGMCRLTSYKIRSRSIHGHVRRSKTRDGRLLAYASSEWHSWSNMRARCRNKNHHAYADYGGRGIRVCERWVVRGGQGFKNFIDDMGPRPAGKTLDRINPQGHYEPTNCKWATWDEQGKNRRNVIWPNGGGKMCKMPSVESYLAMEARLEESMAAM